MIAFPLGEGGITVSSKDGTVMTDEVLYVKVTFTKSGCFRRSYLEQGNLIHRKRSPFPKGEGNLYLVFYVSFAVTVCFHTNRVLIPMFHRHPTESGKEKCRRFRDACINGNGGVFICKSV